MAMMQELGELSLSLIPSCRTLPGQPPIPPISEPADHVSLTWHIYHTRKKEKKALCLNFHEISGCWAIHTWAIATPMDRHLRQIALIITRRLRLRRRMPKVSIRIYSLDTLAPRVFGFCFGPWCSSRFCPVFYRGITGITMQHDVERDSENGPLNRA